LGGHIELSSRLGEGTRFVLTLPRVAPASTVTANAAG
jgi:signal transduction histidine kinase